MLTATRHKRRSSRRPRPIHKPRGVLQPRVQRVGPEHFGIVSIDCAKARSKWMLTDFYGTVLVEPTELVHSQGHFAIAVAQVHEAMARHHLKDLIVAVEQTGEYHQPVKRAFRAAGFECRIVHPLASKPFRQAAHPGIKTDDTDLVGIFCAAANGFGLLEPELDPPAARLRLWVRHRRSLVEKRSAVCCQLKEHWQATLPGFDALFDNLWASPAALVIAGHFAAPEAVQQAGLDGLRQMLQASGQRAQTRTLERILAWARIAPSADPESALHQQLALALDEDRRQETRQIRAAEVEIVAGRRIVPHACLLPRGYILDKLIAFHQDHDTSPEPMLADLQRAADQLPAAEHPREAAPLAKRLAETRAARRRGPQPLGDILPLLLARLGAGDVESTLAGVRDLG